MSRWINARTFLIAMLACIATAIILSSAFMRWPDLPTLLLGREKGLLDQIGGLATTALLVVGAAYTARTFRLSQLTLRLSDRTFRQSQRQAEAATYERGAEMLANDKSSANINGMYIMNAAARRSPERFWQPACFAISAYLTDATKERYAVLRRFHGAHFRWPIESRPELPNLEDTPFSALAALTALSNLRQTEQEWPEAPNEGSRLIEMQGFALEFCRLSGAQLDRTIIRNAFIGSVHLVECNFDNSDIHLIVYRAIYFDAKCSLRNTKFRITDAWGLPLGDPQFTAKVYFEVGCDLSTAKIFDKPLSSVVAAMDAS